MKISQMKSSKNSNFMKGGYLCFVLKLIRHKAQDLKANSDEARAKYPLITLTSLETWQVAILMSAKISVWKDRNRFGC